jgi:hypothetical protein
MLPERGTVRPQQRKAGDGDEADALRDAHLVPATDDGPVGRGGKPVAEAPYDLLRSGAGASAATGHEQKTGAEGGSFARIHEGYEAA